MKLIDKAYAWIFTPKIQERIRKIMHLKVYIIRVYSYMAIGQGMAIIYLLFSDLAQRGIIPTIHYVWPVIGCLFVVFMFLGWLEVKLKFMEKEQKKVFDETPQMVEMVNNIRELKGWMELQKAKQSNSENGGSFIVNNSESEIPAPKPHDESEQSPTSDENN